MKKYALLVGLLVAVSYTLGLFSGIENFFEDLLFSSKPISSEIVIVAIDNESIEKIGQWPWPREVFARALRALETAPPKTVALDVIFADPSRLGAADDATLADALSRVTYPVVLPVEANPLIIQDGSARADDLISTLPAFLGGKEVSVGHVNLVLDPDGVARRVPLAISVEGQSIPAMAARAAGVGTGDDVERIVYAGSPGSIQRIPFWRLISKDAPDLSGKIVFVGATSPDLHDEKPTPFSRGTQMPGVEIQAQIANMLIRGYRLVSLPWVAALAWFLIAAFIPALIFGYVARPAVAIGFNILIGVGYTIGLILFFEHGIAGNLIHVNLAWIAGTASAFTYRYRTIDKERRQMRHAFSKYVSRDVLEELMRDPSKVKLGGEEKIATVFFSDVRGFTTLSETLSATGLVQFLNRYYSVMSDIVLNHRGVVDKYIGDAIMAFWGAPLDNDNQALDAVRASVAMVDALVKFNQESQARDEAAIDIGIGLNRGSVVAGNVGSSERFDYTVMGDTTNLASRLEGQTKTYGVHIIASESVVHDLPADTDIRTRELDRVKVKGKTKPVTIYQVIDPHLQAFVEKILPDFDQLRVAYYAGQFEQCVLIGERILAQGDDGPTKVLVDRARHFLEHPHPSWQGVYEIKTK